MDILSFILAIILVLGFIFLLVSVALAYIAYRIAKNHPITAIFIFLLIFVIGTLEVLTVEGVVSGVATYAAGLISLLASYKSLEKAFKKR